MGRWGSGVFASDSVLDAASDMCHEIGINLERPGDDEWADVIEMPKLTIEETRKRLDNGLFKQCYDRYKRRPYELAIFVLLAMRSGPKITKTRLNYLKAVAPIAFDYLPEAQQEIKVACEEYVSGKPYQSWTFDFESAPEEDMTSPNYDPEWKAKRIAEIEKRVQQAQAKEAAETAAKKEEVQGKKATDDNADDDTDEPVAKKQKIEIDPNELAAASRSLIFAANRRL